MKKFFVKTLAVINLLFVILMVIVGYSYYVDPAAIKYFSVLGLVFPIFLVINMTFLVLWIFINWRYVILPVIGFAVVFVPITIYVPLNMPAAMPSGVIKVLSFNVLSYHGTEGGSTFDTIYTYLNESNSDIICLQEDNGIGGKMLAKLNNMLPYHKTVQVGGGPFYNRLGVYSRFPILKTEEIDYGSRGNGSVAFFLKVYGDTVIVINNHFESNKLSGEDRNTYKDMLKGNLNEEQTKSESKRLIVKLSNAAVTRSKQAKMVREFIDAHSDYPMIVCGDFNDNPLSHTRYLLAKDMIDCFVESGRGLGLSYNQKGFNVRIDNILCSKHYEPYNCKVGSEIKVSDHYPIYCWIKMQGK